MIIRPCWQSWLIAPIEIQACKLTYILYNYIHKLIKKSSGSRQAVVMQSSGSRQTVIRQSVLMQLLGCCQECIRQISRTCFTIQEPIFEPRLLFHHKVQNSAYFSNIKFSYQGIQSHDIWRLYAKNVKKALTLNDLKYLKLSKVWPTVACTIPLWKIVL